MISVFSINLFPINPRFFTLFGKGLIQKDFLRMKSAAILESVSV